MRALSLHAGNVRFEAAHPRPLPAADEVLVRVLCAGICETDLQLKRGYMGFSGILGHEFVGIAESGDLQEERVVGEINCSCRTCDDCRNGRSNHCPHRSVIGILNHDGAFADFVAVPRINLHPVPDEVETRRAVFTEPLAAAFRIPEQFELQPEHRVVVLGDGRLGNLCAQVIRLHGSEVSVVGKHPRKLALLSQLGISATLLQDAVPTRSADTVVDCTGSPTGLATAVKFVKPQGTIVLKTTVAGEQTVSLAPLVIDEITLIGSRCGPFRPALEALRKRQIDVEPLIDRTYPLEEGVTALEAAGSRDTLKVLLSISQQ